MGDEGATGRGADGALAAGGGTAPAAGIPGDESDIGIGASISDEGPSLVTPGAPARTTISCAQRRHFMRTVLPATFSSPIWYLAWQLSQTNFIG
jgi:hypothetical protein